MKAFRLFLALAFGLVIALLISVQLWTTANAQSIREFPMSPAGGVEEINADSEGNLWVGEYVADNIFRIDPSDNTLTRYDGEFGGIVDAQRGPDNLVWYNGYDNGSLGRINLANNTLITWTIPGSLRPWGLAIAADDNIWISEHDVAKIYRFNPGTNELCTFVLPNDSKSVYLHATAEGIWLADYITDALLRLNTTNHQLTSWKIDTNGGNANPYGMTSNGDGTLWWADGGLAAVGHLNPTTNRVTLYKSSGVSSPTYLDIVGDNVWFIDSFFNQFGLFNPVLAASTSQTIVPTTANLTPDCTNLGAGNNATLTVTSDDISFVDTDVAAPTRLDCGWAVQKTPTGTSLYDIAIANGRAWISDPGRSTLIATADNLSDLIGSACNFSYMPSLRR